MFVFSQLRDALERNLRQNNEGMTFSAMECSQLLLQGSCILTSDYNVASIKQN